MPRKTFYSFHYIPDSWRVSKIRNIGALEDNKPASDNDWETIKGDNAKIERWIANQLYGRSCTIVLIGANTAGRKWITYEINESWKKGMGVLGIHVHNITDSNGNTSSKGSNPFSGITIDGVSLESVVPVHNPTGYNWESKDYRNHIADNLESWIEAAIKVRNKY
ncbi:MAG: TIR domain-containing protein [Flavobacteriales bacterium]|nr:TIR domain-containing protein [Flavobacteriales bacterium]